MATVADRILEHLVQVPGGLDDGQLAEALTARRQTVNQACRRLAEQGRLLRATGPNGRIVNRLLPQHRALLGDTPEPAAPEPAPADPVASEPPAAEPAVREPAVPEPAVPEPAAVEEPLAPPVVPSHREPADDQVAGPEALPVQRPDGDGAALLRDLPAPRDGEAEVVPEPAQGNGPEEAVPGDGTAADEPSPDDGLAAAAAEDAVVRVVEVEGVLIEADGVSEPEVMAEVDIVVVETETEAGAVEADAVDAVAVDADAADTVKPGGTAPSAPADDEPADDEQPVGDEQPAEAEQPAGKKRRWLWWRR